MKIIPLAKRDGGFPPYLDYTHFKEILVGINAVKHNALEDMGWEFVNVRGCPEFCVNGIVSG